MNFSRIKDLRNPWIAALPLCLVFVMVFSSVSFAQSWEAKYEEIPTLDQQIRALDSQAG